MTHQTSTIRVYAELHYSVRQPQAKIRLNSKLLDSKIAWSQRINDYQENVIIESYGTLLPTNQLEIIMCDKTDADIKQIDGKWTDHLIDIKEIEVDDIKFEMSLYRNSEFRHSQPSSWVEKMKSRGIHINPVYHNCAEMRINGTVTVKFDTPIWRWVTQDLSKIWK